MATMTWRSVARPEFGESNQLMQQGLDRIDKGFRGAAQLGQNVFKDQEDAGSKIAMANMARVTDSADWAAALKSGNHLGGVNSMYVNQAAMGQIEGKRSRLLGDDSTLLNMDATRQNMELKANAEARAAQSHSERHMVRGGGGGGGGGGGRSGGGKSGKVSDDDVVASIRLGTAAKAAYARGDTETGDRLTAELDTMSVAQGNKAGAIEAGNIQVEQAAQNFDSIARGWVEDDYGNELSPQEVAVKRSGLNKSQRETYDTLAAARAEQGGPAAKYASPTEAIPDIQEPAASPSGSEASPKFDPRMNLSMGDGSTFNPTQKDSSGKPISERPSLSYGAGMSMPQSNEDIMAVSNTAQGGTIQGNVATLREQRGGGDFGQDFAQDQKMSLGYQNGPPAPIGYGEGMVDPRLAEAAGMARPMQDAVAQTGISSAEEQALQFKNDEFAKKGYNLADLPPPEEMADLVKTANVRLVIFENTLPTLNQRTPEQLQQYNALLDDVAFVERAAKDQYETNRDAKQAKRKIEADAERAARATSATQNAGNIRAKLRGEEIAPSVVVKADEPAKQAFAVATGKGKLDEIIRNPKLGFPTPEEFAKIQEEATKSITQAHAEVSGATKRQAEAGEAPVYEPITTLPTDAEGRVDTDEIDRYRLAQKIEGNDSLARDPNIEFSSYIDYMQEKFDPEGEGAKDMNAFYKEVADKIGMKDGRESEIKVRDAINELRSAHTISSSEAAAVLTHARQKKGWLPDFASGDKLGGIVSGKGVKANLELISKRGDKEGYAVAKSARQAVMKEFGKAESELNKALAAVRKSEEVRGGAASPEKQAELVKAWNKVRALNVGEMLDAKGLPRRKPKS